MGHTRPTPTRRQNQLVPMLRNGLEVDTQLAAAALAIELQAVGAALGRPTRNDNRQPMDVPERNPCFRFRLHKYALDDHRKA